MTRPARPSPPFALIASDTSFKRHLCCTITASRPLMTPGGRGRRRGTRAEGQRTPNKAKRTRPGEAGWGRLMATSRPQTKRRSMGERVLTRFAARVVVGPRGGPWGRTFYTTIVRPDRIMSALIPLSTGWGVSGLVRPAPGQPMDPPPPFHKM